jgi:hypothetical protein
MSRKCKCCHHECVDQINEAILRREPIRNISKRYKISASSVYRHKKNHMSRAVNKALEQEELARGKTILEVVDELESGIRNLIYKLDKTGDYRGELQGFGELRRHIELKAKLFGVEEEDAELNLIDHPAWVELRTKILKCLEPFPEVFEEMINTLEVKDGDF